MEVDFGAGTVKAEYENPAGTLMQKVLVDGSPNLRHEEGLPASVWRVCGEYVYGAERVDEATEAIMSGCVRRCRTLCSMLEY